MEEDLLCKIERFMHLKPPTFSYSEDPLDVVDWLKVIETKLDVTSCTDEECTHNPKLKSCRSGFLSLPSTSRSRSRKKHPNHAKERG